MALVEHRQHDRIGFSSASVQLRWISTERQHVLGDEAAQPRLAPIFGGGDRVGAGALLLGQAGGQQDEVAMAGMVGEIDALALGRLAAVPDRPHAGDHPGRAPTAPTEVTVCSKVKVLARREVMSWLSRRRDRRMPPANTAKRHALPSQQAARAGDALGERRVVGRVGFRRMRARTSSTAAPPAASSAWLAIRRNSSASKTSKAERASVAHAGASRPAVGPPARRQRTVWQRQSDAGAGIGGRDRERPDRLQHAAQRANASALSGRHRRSCRFAATAAPTVPQMHRPPDRARIFARLRGIVRAPGRNQPVGDGGGAALEAERAADQHRAVGRRASSIAARLRASTSARRARGRASGC